MSLTRRAPSGLVAAFRDASRFDRQMVSVSSGLLAAIPVVAVLGGGIAGGDPVAGVSMGAGALLVGIAWRIRGGRPPLAAMATDAVMMSLATFTGSVTGSVGWLHLIVIVLWCLFGGLLIAVGNRGGAIGTQAIIAVIVFGRFSEPAPSAAGLAGLVLAGALAQVVFLFIVRWPSPLRGQRDATAAAFRALAELSAGPDNARTLPAALALDEAERSLAAPALFGDPAVTTLRSLANEGHRLRVQLSAMHVLLRQIAETGGDPARIETGRRALVLASEALDLAARALQGDRKASAELRNAIARFDALIDGDEPPQGSVLRRRLTALGGQLRAVASMAPAAGEGSGLRSRRPQPAASKLRQQVREFADQLRANANLDSPAGRHALRLAVVVPAAELIARQLPVERGYWIPVAAATALRPEFTATLTRGAERAVGTCLGVGLAGLIAVTLHPGSGVTVLIVGVLAWAGYSVFPASFALGFAFITSVVVFLLNELSPDTLATAGARLLDTFIGGAIGLLAYALWPTWAHGSARAALARLVDASRAYTHAVLSALSDGRPAAEGEMRSLSRRSRLARTTAEESVGRSLGEPATRRIDAEQSQAVLGALRRLVGAVHVLRLDAQEEHRRPAQPGLRPLAEDIDGLLRQVAAVLDDNPGTTAPRPLPDLRGDYDTLRRGVEDDPGSAVLLAELDEIVDAANGLASRAGLTAVDSPAGRDNPLMTSRGR